MSTVLKRSDVVWIEKNFEWYKGDYNVVNLTELTAEKEIDIGLFEKVVHRVVLQNPNLRYQ